MTHLALWRAKTWSLPPHATVRFRQYTMEITDGPNFYMQYKDEFVRRVYAFHTECPDPVVIDGGSNIGMSILAFKSAYPNARITAFEPDPAIFEILRRNMARNGVRDVTLINAGLARVAGAVGFVVDGGAGGQRAHEGGTITVRMERLSEQLQHPVDFLKLNIEGEELDVLEEAAASGRLQNVRRMVLEYHGWPSGPQRLGAILQLLEQQGFRYMVHDFDAETCAISKPPFAVSKHQPWFCLVYATQLDS